MNNNKYKFDIQKLHNLHTRLTLLKIDSSSGSQKKHLNSDHLREICKELQHIRALIPTNNTKAQEILTNCEAIIKSFSNIRDTKVQKKAALEKANSSSQVHTSKSTNTPIAPNNNYSIYKESTIRTHYNTKFVIQQLTDNSRNFRNHFEEYNFIFSSKLGRNAYTKYKISKYEVKNGQTYISTYTVYGNIDLDKLNCTNPNTIEDRNNYCRSVVYDLLSDKNLDEALELSIGYVGELQKNKYGAYQKVLLSEPDTELLIHRNNLNDNGVKLTLQNGNLNIVNVGSLTDCTSKKTINRYAIITYSNNYKNINCRYIYGNIDLEKLRTLETALASGESNQTVNIRDLLSYKKFILNRIASDTRNNAYIGGCKSENGFYIPTISSHFKNYFENNLENNLNISKQTNIDIPL